ncbi:MAG: SRPBCC family protein [Pseudonocardiaceae bacterium]
MELEHTFTVPAPVDTVWRALLDPERVAPCFPGATVTSASGEEFAGTVQVRLGPISLQYHGSGRFTEIDEVAHRTVIEASGAASEGQSTAAATVTTSLAENGPGTVVTVQTDLSITGKPAQFGRGLLEDVGGKIIGQFADNLASSLRPEQSPAVPASPAPAARPTPASSAQLARPAVDEIDLLDAGRGGAAKRLVPAFGGLAVLWLLIRWLRRR